MLEIPERLDVPDPLDSWTLDEGLTPFDVGAKPDVGDAPSLEILVLSTDFVLSDAVPEEAPDMSALEGAVGALDSPGALPLVEVPNDPELSETPVLEVIPVAEERLI